MFNAFLGTKNCKVVIIQYAYLTTAKHMYAFLKFGQLSR